MTEKELIEIAIRAREFAYTPYSHYKVGAALLTKTGKIYTGCNIENAAYTPSNCGERTAIFKAVSEGEREFEMMAVVAGPEGGELEETSSCGVCRQVMMEFCNPETFKIIFATSPEKYQVYTLKEILPMGFGPSNLNF